jgi:hypothetical protein
MKSLQNDKLLKDSSTRGYVLHVRECPEFGLNDPDLIVCPDMRRLRPQERKMGFRGVKNVFGRQEGKICSRTR